MAPASWAAVLDHRVVVPPGGAEGVLLTRRPARGFGPYVQGGRLCHVLNYVAPPVPWRLPTRSRRVARSCAMRSSDQRLSTSSRARASRPFELYVGGALVAVSEVPYSLVASPALTASPAVTPNADSVDPAAFRPRSASPARRARRPDTGRGDCRRLRPSCARSGPPVTAKEPPRADPPHFDDCLPACPTSSFAAHYGGGHGAGATSPSL
jgi:hypothetical protein